MAKLAPGAAPAGDTSVAPNPFLTTHEPHHLLHEPEPLRHNPFLLDDKPKDEPRFLVAPTSVAPNPFLTTHEPHHLLHEPEPLRHNPFLLDDKPKEVGADTRVDTNPFLIVHGPDAEVRTLVDLTKAGFHTGSIPNDPFLSHAAPAERRASAPAAGNAFMSQSRPPGDRLPDIVAPDPFLVGETHIPTKVSTDPFLTRTLRNRVDKDPFLQHVGYKKGLRVTEDVRKDPFLAKPPPDTESTCLRRFELACIRGRWFCFRQALAKQGEFMALVQEAPILAPWAVFMIVVLIWIIGGHYMPFMSTCLLYVCGSFLLMQVVICPCVYDRCESNRRRMNFALSCLLAIVCGICVGHLIWADTMRQVWWMSTGVEYKGNTTAVTPAAARADAAWIHFSDAPQSTSVDVTRSSSYRYGAHTYCAAPLLSPVALGGGDAASVRVSYWVIGMDCCEAPGAFSCDASREREGKYGVVMLEHGFPSPGCNRQKFEAAVAKAEAQHSLVSAEAALFVRWVKDPNVIFNEATRWAMLLTLFCSFVALWVFVAIAWALDRSEKFVIKKWGRPIP